MEWSHVEYFMKEIKMSSLSLLVFFLFSHRKKRNTENVLRMMCVKKRRHKHDPETKEKIKYIKKSYQPFNLIILRRN